MYENGEAFSNSTSYTIKASNPPSGGGGGGGSSAYCGDGICQAGRETCSSCSADCGTCSFGGLNLVVPSSGGGGGAAWIHNVSNNTTVNETMGEVAPVEPDVLEPEPVADPLAVGAGWGVFTDFLKKPRTLLVFAVLIAVIATLLLAGKSSKKKKSDFLKEFGD